MKKRILIAEDDANIRSGLIDALEMDGHEAHGVGDGAAAISQFRQEKWDLLILDLMMPEKSGYEVAREVRAIGSDVPILMLTAKSEEIDKVLGFEMGTDDYVTKLGHIIICAHLKTEHLVNFFTLRGKHENGNIRTNRTDFPGYLVATFLRHH